MPGSDSFPLRPSSVPSAASPLRGDSIESSDSLPGTGRSDGGRASSSVRADDLAAAVQQCIASAGADQAAFTLIHDRLTPGIRAYFTRRLPGGAAHPAIDDLVQRVWKGVWDAFAAQRYNPDRAAISTFAYAIAAKTWMRHLRSERARGGSENIRVLEDDVQVLDLSEDPASEAAAAELLEAVRRCLRAPPGDAPTAAGEPTTTLTEQERSIVLAAAGGVSDRALAQRLGLAASTVNARKQTGLEKIRRYLARLGHRSDSGERRADRGEQRGTG